MNYLRHRLTREETRKVEEHLSDCNLCSDAIEGLKKINAEASMMKITADLQKMARKRRLIKKKIFSAFDMISIFTVVFLILFLLLLFLMFWKRLIV